MNLFRNKLSLFITEVSLSGSNTHYKAEKYSTDTIHTPELTTLGANAKGWIRAEDGLYLHKVGKNEFPASDILEALQIKHIPYYESDADEVSMYLSDERHEQNWGFLMDMEKPKELSDRQWKAVQARKEQLIL